jgi:hypothetical protein
MTVGRFPLTLNAALASEGLKGTGPQQAEHPGGQGLVLGIRAYKLFSRIVAAPRNFAGAAAFFARPHPAPQAVTHWR